MGFYNKHSAKITSFEAAEKYLRAHLNGSDRIFTSEWKASRKAVWEKADLKQEYDVIKDEIGKCGVRRNMENGKRGFVGG